MQRLALAGMLWSKQFYHYIVEQWLRGDPAQPPRLSASMGAIGSGGTCIMNG